MSNDVRVDELREASATLRALAADLDDRRAEKLRSAAEKLDKAGRLVKRVKQGNRRRE